MARFKQNLFIFLIGGFCYGIIELLWRQRTHWTMILTGGACFLLLYRVFEYLQDVDLIHKCIIGSVIITVIELVIGFIVNILLGMEVWDYSWIHLNLFGQICILYSVLWGFLCILINWMFIGINKIKVYLT